MIYEDIKIPQPHITLWRLINFHLTKKMFLTMYLQLLHNLIPILHQEKPSDDFFIKSLWSYQIGILISNFFDFISSPAVWYLIFTWSFVKCELTIWGWLQTKLCNISIFSFVIFHPFIFLFVSIHAIPYYLVFIIYILDFYFIVLLFIYFFETPNILEGDFTALSLTKKRMWTYMSFFAYTRCVNNCHQHFLMKKVNVGSYIKFSGVLIIIWYWKILLFFSIAFITK